MNHETRLAPGKRTEKKPNYALRRAIAIGTIGLATVFGVNKVMEATTDDSKEKAAQQAEQTLVEQINSGQEVGVKTVSYELFSGVKVRNTPTEDNKNNYGDFSDNIAFTVKGDESLIVHNPIVIDKHGDWVGFLDPRNNEESKLAYSEDDLLWANVAGIREQRNKEGEPFMQVINPEDSGYDVASLQETGRLDFVHEQDASVAGEVATAFYMQHGK